MNGGYEESNMNAVTPVKKILSAIFYGVASFLITVVNKSVLTSYDFPSYQVLGLSQTVTTLIVLWLCRRTHVVQFPSLDRNMARHIWPLPFIYLGNMATGLGSTKKLSLPMYTALRRFSIPMTIIGEKLVLGIDPSWSVQVSAFSMVAGALLAAADDLNFSSSGYIIVLINDVFTAANGVYIKKKLNHNGLGNFGFMFYNALFMLIPAFILAWWTAELEKSAAFEHWADILFQIQFLLSCVMGFVLSYSIMLCTQYNSALTTTIIGCFKNILITYLGMVVGDDYIFSWFNFVGLNISVAASLCYTYTAFKHNNVNNHMVFKKAKSGVDVI